MLGYGSKVKHKLAQQVKWVVTSDKAFCKTIKINIKAASNRETLNFRKILKVFKDASNPVCAKYLSWYTNIYLIHLYLIFSAIGSQADDIILPSILSLKQSCVVG